MMELVIAGNHNDLIAGILILKSINLNKSVFFYVNIIHDKRKNKHTNIFFVA